MDIQFQNSPPIEPDVHCRRIHRRAKVDSNSSIVRYVLEPLKNKRRIDSSRRYTTDQAGRRYSADSMADWDEEDYEEENKGGLLKPFLIALISVLVVGGIIIAAIHFINPGGSSNGPSDPGRNNPGESLVETVDGSGENIEGESQESVTVAPVVQETTAAPEPETTPAYTMMHPTERLNVRNLPTTDGSVVIATLNPTDYVPVYGVEGTWAIIEYNGQRAYCSYPYLVE